MSRPPGEFMDGREDDLVEEILRKSAIAHVTSGMNPYDVTPDLLRTAIIELSKVYSEKVHAQKPFVPGDKIQYAGRVFGSEEVANLVDASLDAYLTLGKYGKQFEEKFKNYTGLRSIVLANSGSSANLLALSTLTSKRLGDARLKPGQEVITCATGFPTTVNPIIQNGLVPAFVDVELGTYNANVSQLEQMINENTGAIMLAHTLGNPFDLDKIVGLAKKHNLYLLEDTCDALGSRYDGKIVGTFGDLMTVSFYPAHHITMGEGGLIGTNKPFLAKIVESFRDWGRACWCEPGKSNTCGERFAHQLGELPFGYDHKFTYDNIGYNLKPNDFSPAFGSAQMDRLSGFIEARKRNFGAYYTGLKYLDAERFLILPNWDEKADPAWFGFPITVKEDAPFTRNELTQYLEEKGIETRNIFAGNITRQPAYQGIKQVKAPSLVNSDLVMNNGFFIGVYPGITPDRAEYVVDAFERFFKEGSHE